MKLPLRVGFVLLSSALVVATGLLVTSLVAPALPISSLPAPPGSPLWQPQLPRPAYPFQPRYGQDGKDVVWIPSPDGVVAAMLDLAGVTGQDYVIDLGSGDGRTVIAAARRGARALGIEYDAGLVDLSRQAAEAAGVTARASFVQADIFESDLSHATVISMFLLPSLNLRLRPTLLDLKPGTRVVSNTFNMDDWLPDGTARATGPCESWCLALLWIVPAKVHGRWQLAQGTLTLTQHFQDVSGTMTTDGGSHPVERGRLHGDEIRFVVSGVDYSGRVPGDVMAGTWEVADQSRPWRANRIR